MFRKVSRPASLLFMHVESIKVLIRQQQLAFLRVSFVIQYMDGISVVNGPLSHPRIILPYEILEFLQNIHGQGVKPCNPLY